MNPYERFADPSATFVMIQVQVMGRDGRPGRPFALRVTEEEFENMQASSRRQYERRQWPQPGMGHRYEPAGQYRPGYDNPFYDFDPRFTSPQEEHAYHERARRAKEQANANAKAKAEREKQERERREYFANFGDAANAGARGFEDFYRKFQDAHDDPTQDKFFWDGEPVTEEEFNKRQAAKDRGSNQSKSEKQLKDRLGELAGTLWMDTLDMKAVYNKAKRRCHPDMEGGSHELWIELEEIAHLLGIVKLKKPSRTR